MMQALGGYTRHFTIEGKYLGTMPPSEAEIIPRSKAYFCPDCGDVWCRVAVEGAGQVWLPWLVVTIQCRLHPMSLLYPAGSLASSYLEPIEVNELPPEVLKWEFHRHLDFIDYLDKRGIR